MSADLTEDLLNGLPDAILVLSPTGTAVFANTAARVLFEDDVVGHNIGIPVKDFSLLQLVSKGQIRRVELLVADASSWRSGFLAVVMRDVTVREKLAEDMRSKIFELKGLADLIAVAPNPMVRVSRTGKVIWANDAFKKSFGTIDNVYGIPLLAAAKDKLATLLLPPPEQATRSTSLRSQTFDALAGSEMPVLVSSVPLVDHSKKTPSEFLLHFSAVDASDELLQAYLGLVFADVALGLPNERGLLLQSTGNWEDGNLEQAAFAVLVPSDEPAAVESVINRIIALISSLWLDVVPHQGEAATEMPLVPLRLGRISPTVIGCIISLPREAITGAGDAALTMAKKLVDAVRDDVSIGIVVDTRASKTLQAAMDEAVFAAQISLETGEPFHAFQDDYSAVLERRRALTAAVRTAVEKKSFILEFQARMDVRTEEIRSAEILARCVDPTMGIIPPSDFIPILRRLNLMSELTEIVGHLAIQQLHDWQKRKRRPISLSINIVPSDLSSSRALSVLRSMARQFEGKGVFEVELAESYPFPSSQHGKLRALLEGMGIVLSLDDFGTGYSSFAYLISLPISVIKIDKSFIDDLLDDQRRVAAMALIRSIVALARELKLSVCAEGVERQDQLDILIPLGIDEIQGYLVSKPLSAKDFEATYIAEHS